jgi:glycosyltransferase involved in cell wall biosynthesis
MTSPGEGPREPLGTTLVIVPAFNEAASVGKVVEGIGRALPGAEVLVVDDCSSDETGEIAAGAGARVLTHMYNLGYGAALQTGFKFALAEDYRYAALVDADGQHEPRFLPALLEGVWSGKDDIVVGSRFLEPTGFPLRPVKKIGIWLFRTIASVLTGLRITDATSGFQALSGRALDLFASDCFPADYPDADVLIMAHRAGLRLREIPVRMYPDDIWGQSMHGGWRPLFYVPKMMLSIVMVMLRPGGCRGTTE